VALLAERAVSAVTYEDWLGLDSAEVALAESLSRGERVKLGTWETMRSACAKEQCAANSLEQSG
jgi:ferredoxin--NADP+ reductase